MKHPPKTASPSEIASFHRQLKYDARSGELIWRLAHNGGHLPAGRVAGGLRPDGYRQVWIDGRLWRAHRVIWEMHRGPIPNDMQIDHSDGDRDNNRLENLRLATISQNQANRKPAPGALPKGVWLFNGNRANPYGARIKVGGKEKFLGCYASPEEAHDAYCKAAGQIFSEFSRAS